VGIGMRRARERGRWDLGWEKECNKMLGEEGKIEVVERKKGRKEY